MDLGDYLHVSLSLPEPRGQSGTLTQATSSALPLLAQTQPGHDTTPSPLVLEPRSPEDNLWRHVLQGWIRAGTLGALALWAAKAEIQVVQSSELAHWVPGCPPDIWDPSSDCWHFERKNWDV